MSLDAAAPTRQAPAATGADAPFLVLAVPVLNEEAHVEACLASLLPQWPAGRCEVLVLDGGSTDATREVVAALAARHPNLRLVANPGRLQSAAVNLAARVGRAEAAVLVRADAHAFYPPDFLARVVGALGATGATSVVVPMRTVADPADGLHRAIAAAQNARFGNGGAAHRAGGVSGWVDHGHHAAFDRAHFLSLGGYDEAFSHNEDAEFDARSRAAGGRVWMCAEAVVDYVPRRTLPALARQYAKHGAGRARTLAKHGMRPRPRQMAPVAALLGNAGSLLLAPVLPALLLVPLAYLALCAAWAASAAWRARDPALLAAGAAAAVMHHAWAFGFLRGLARARRAPAAVLRPRESG